jgi:CubicO group peptidase (beta-lactamase class C family)
MLRKLGIGLVGLALLAGIAWTAIGSDWRAFLSNPPTGNDVLFWSQDQREAGFRMMDRVPFIIESRTIGAGDQTRELAEGAPLGLGLDVDAYLEENNVASVVILQDGAVRLEAYGLGFSEKGRWTSFSVAKSLTSTLVGAAVKDGHIKSLDDKVSDYVRGLEGSAYDDVTIEQLLTMTSGVAWNEDYSDPQSDVALFLSHQSTDDQPNVVSYLKALPRAHPAGEVWNYSTGETNLIGILVSDATGRNLSEYLSEKIWAPYGMEQKATWLIGDDGVEVSGCCIQAATRDFARFGQFMMDGAQIDGAPIVPNDWVEMATSKQANIGAEVEGYGFQWWTQSEGAYDAKGIFGQGIFIDPTRQLIIASNSNWTTALGNKDGEAIAQNEFYKIVQAAIDREAQ